MRHTERQPRADNRNKLLATECKIRSGLTPRNPHLVNA